MKADHLDTAASGVAATATKLGVVWGGVMAGFADLPWSQFAAALACLYSVHLIVGWWLDRIGKRPQSRRRNNRGNP